ncbi:MAG: hypothetical protein AAF383_18165 [Cyanobacteria bacterium P01_A01_bin.83]
MENAEVKAVGALATTVASTAGAGSITVATVTTSAPGILGAIGLTTTTTVALPVAGILGASALLGYGVYKGVKMASKK